MADLAAVAVLGLLVTTVLAGLYYLRRWLRARRRGTDDAQFLRLALVGLGYLAGLVGAVLVVVFLFDPY